MSDLMLWLERAERAERTERAERIRTQQHNDKNKLYALHAPEVECIGKGKARMPCEFGVKSAVVVSHEHGLLLGARTFPGNPYDGHILSAVLKQVSKLLQDHSVKLKQIVVDLGFRSVDADNPDKQIIRRGRCKRLSAQQTSWLRRCRTAESGVGDLKSNYRLEPCWLQRALGNALHSISCAAGCIVRWLMRATPAWIWEQFFAPAAALSLVPERESDASAVRPYTGPHLSTSRFIAISSRYASATKSGMVSVIDANFAMPIIQCLLPASDWDA